MPYPVSRLASWLRDARGRDQAGVVADVGRCVCAPRVGALLLLRTLRALTELCSGSEAGSYLRLITCGHSAGGGEAEAGVNNFSAPAPSLGFRVEG